MPPINNYLDDDPFEPFYSPPRRSEQGAGSGNLLQHSISPWSASSYSANPNSLTLPPLRGLFGEEEPSIFQPIQLERPMSNSRPYSQPRVVPPPQYSSATLQTRLQGDHFDLSDSPDQFLNLEGHSHMSTPNAANTRASSFVDLTSSSPTDMAPSRKRKGPSVDEPQARDKRQRAVLPSSPASRASTRSPQPVIGEVDITEIDNDQQYEEYNKKQQEELAKQQNQERADKPVRLADFQCIICLDNPTDLTVTHCHLFCSLCLHEALHTGAQKSNCPVCRTVISTTRKTSRNGDLTMKQPKNGVYALQMKLMTARRKEKMPASIR